ncbi:MAG: SDR family oxidoreductase [Coxiellaceae bacterium]|jgi:dTDP-4-dehydrorhamnose reductase|nr:SDR family oxidoreductase [Coxiellaceae bacterium]
MRILILGGDGMLGHQLFLHLRENHEVKVTLKKNLSLYSNIDLFDYENSYFGVDALNHFDLIKIFSDFMPEIVINAIGIIKQRCASDNVYLSLQINSLLPHRLLVLCKLIKSKLIHFSTDCVFSGLKGNYTEEDLPDAQDVYGRTKILGEVVEGNCLTLRVSIVGLELFNKRSLIEWFLQQRGEISGFANAIYTGISNIEIARIIEHILVFYPKLCGLFHIASEKISKYDLLCRLYKALNKKNIKIRSNDKMFCDRSLVDKKFHDIVDYKILGWNDMLSELAMLIKKRDDIIKYR